MKIPMVSSHLFRIIHFLFGISRHKIIIYGIQMAPNIENIHNLRKKKLFSPNIQIENIMVFRHLFVFSKAKTRKIRIVTIEINGFSSFENSSIWLNKKNLWKIQKPTIWLLLASIFTTVEIIDLDIGGEQSHALENFFFIIETHTKENIIIKL